MFANVLMLVSPLYMMQLYDRVLPSQSTDTLVYLTLAAVGAMLVFTLLDLLRSRILIRVSTWTESRLGPQALECTVGVILQSPGYGIQALRDIAHLRQFIASTALFTLFDAPWVPLYLGVIFFCTRCSGWWVWPEQ